MIIRLIVDVMTWVQHERRRLPSSQLPTTTSNNAFCYSLKGFYLKSLGTGWANSTMTNDVAHPKQLRLLCHISKTSYKISH